MNRSEYPLVDTHTHILPGMDDGASNSEIGVKMVESLLEQGVKKIFATPHFYYHRESVTRFLERRDNAYLQFMSEWKTRGKKESPILLGAEISIERDLTYSSDLNKLCVGRTKLLLLELPFSRIKGWEISTIENITFKYQIAPIIAHVERYFSLYTDDDLNRLFEIPNVIFQFTSSCLEERKTRAFCLNLIKNKVPVIFGSDGHNMTDRKPEYGKLIDYLEKKLDSSTLDSLINNVYNILGV